MTYILCKKIIEGGNFERNDLLVKLDVFLLGDRITQGQYEELVNLM